MITTAAIYHRPKDNYAYGVDGQKLHLRIRTAKQEVQKVTLRIGDPYDWEKGGTGGNLNGENAHNWVGGQNIEMSLEATTAFYDYWFVETKPEYKRARYAFVLESKEETILFGEKKAVHITSKNNHRELSNIKNFFCFPYVNKKDIFKGPDWVKDAVFYQIFPERFDNGDPSISPENALPWGSVDPKYDSFYGGDIQGIINHLDYLVDLGITGIYLCPIAEAVTNHKYDTSDYFKVDPHFGNDETFKQFVDSAHERGIKIMLDAVFNHIGYYSKEWQDVLEKQETSKYKDWFHIQKFPVLEKPVHKIRDKQAINYESFGFTPYMPKLNTENPEVREHLFAVGKYWIEKFDIDGWRLDVSNEVEHDFWREFRKIVKEVKPDLYIVGEVWHDAMPWLRGDQFDAVMNYPFAEAIISLIAKEDIPVSEFIEEINTNKVNYPVTIGEVTFNLLDSHDTARFLTLAGGNTQKLLQGLTFLLTSSGVPCIYYGTEIGMTGGHDPGCRKCMVWETEKQDLELLEHTKKLIALRKAHQVLKSYNTQWLDIGNEAILSYEKQSMTEKVIVVMNISAKIQKFSLPFVSGYDIYNDKQYDKLEHLEIESYGIKIIKI